MSRKIEEALSNYIGDPGNVLQTRRFIQSFLRVGRIAAWCVALLFAFNILGHYHSLPLGTYGDFIGGVLNPLLTCFSLIALSFTVAMQMTQIRESRRDTQNNADAMRVQSFETTFFNLLDFHNRNVNDLRLNVREIAVHWTNKLGNPPSQPLLILQRHPPAAAKQVFDEVLHFIDAANRREPLKPYRFLQEKHNDVLGHYFRNLYQILKFIDKNAAEMPAGFDPHFYSSLLRAQLNADELRLLLYNCSGKMVDNGAFRKLVIRYRLLEHLPLVYDRRTGQLASAAKLSAADGELCKEYFSYEVIHRQGRKTSGAFGTNPAVAEYLLK